MSESLCTSDNQHKIHILQDARRPISAEQAAPPHGHPAACTDEALTGGSKTLNPEFREDDTGVIMRDIE
eukprot:12424948-Karenia_brevis.AAC.1